jgi:hypothetical protein
MDWIDTKKQCPNIGQKIWGRDKDGQAVLGTYGTYHGYSNILLDLKGKVVLLWSLPQWATYDVIY